MIDDNIIIVKNVTSHTMNSSISHKVNILIIPVVLNTLLDLWTLWQPIITKYDGALSKFMMQKKMNVGQGSFYFLHSVLPIRMAACHCSCFPIDCCPI